MEGISGYPTATYTINVPTETKVGSPVLQNSESSQKFSYMSVTTKPLKIA